MLSAHSCRGCFPKCCQILLISTSKPLFKHFLPLADFPLNCLSHAKRSLSRHKSLISLGELVEIEPWWMEIAPHTPRRPPSIQLPRLPIRLWFRYLSSLLYHQNFRMILLTIEMKTSWSLMRGPRPSRFLMGTLSPFSACARLLEPRLKLLHSFSMDLISLHWNR